VQPKRRRVSAGAGNFDTEKDYLPEDLRGIFVEASDVFETSLDMWTVQTAMGMIVKTVARHYKVRFLKFHWADANPENELGIELHRNHDLVQIDS